MNKLVCHDFTDGLTLLLPVNAEILYVERSSYDNRLYLWALEKPGDERHTITLRLISEGVELPEDYKPIGMFVTGARSNDKMFVFISHQDVSTKEIKPTKKNHIKAEEKCTS